MLMLSISSCRKELNANGNPPTPPTTIDTVITPPVPIIPIDLNTKITASSISGFITDEQNKPVTGATVKVGSITVNSDKYGFFEVKNVEVPKFAALITVNKSGYFKGIKTLIIQGNTSGFTRIKLLPKTVIGSFLSSAGGTVTASTGLKIVFPANAIVVASSGNTYTGNVTVMAEWMNPAGTDIVDQMPGDLRAIDSLGNGKKLITYGMAAVEMISSTGEILQIAPGKKARMSAPIPASLLATSPTTIPLWYFDEAIGFWREEGSAQKTGNEYSGEVSHFSFWNYDVPENYSIFSATFKFENGLPISLAKIKISEITNPQNFTFGYTDLNGHVSGAIPKNKQLKLEIFSDPQNCIIHTQNIEALESTLDIGVVTITNPQILTSIISGTVVNCTNNPVTNGYVIYTANGSLYRQALSNTGTFQFTKTTCSSNSVTFSLIGEDLDNLLASTSVDVTVIPGVNNNVNIKACDVIINQYVEYAARGESKNLVYPESDFSVSHYGDTSITIIITHSATNSKFQTQIKKVDFVVGETYSVNYLITDLSSNSTIKANNSITITEYGGIGQFLSFHFNFSMAEYLNTNPQTYGPPYNLEGKLRIRIP